MICTNKVTCTKVHFRPSTDQTKPSLHHLFQDFNFTILTFGGNLPAKITSDKHLSGILPGSLMFRLLFNY